MTQVSYPGVYIEEVPSSVHTITNVETSIAAFVDFFQQGEMNRPIDIFGMSDFQREFGTLDRRSEASYAISQFFLNGGSHAVVVRVNSPDGTNVPRRADVGVRVTAATGDPTMVFFDARSEGVWGNRLRVEIDHRTVDPTRLFNLTVLRYDSDDVRRAMLVGEERFTNLSLEDGSTRNVVRILEENSRLIRARVPIPPTAAAPAVPLCNGTRGGTWTAAAFATLFNDLRCVQPPPAAPAPLVPRRLRVQFGAGSVYQATLDTWGANEVTTLFGLAARLERAIRTAVDTSAANLPTPPSLTGATVVVVGNERLVVRAGAGDPDRDITDVLTFRDAIGPADDAATLLRLVVGGSAAATATQNVQQYPLGSALLDVAAYDRDVAGADGVAPNADSLVGAVADATDGGIYALRKTDLFNILCLPRSAAMTDDAQMRLVVERGIAFCVQKRAFMLVDIPESVNDVTRVRDWINSHGNFRSRNSALFFPRVRMVDLTDKYQDAYQVRSFPNSGTIAGLMARTDQRGVWRAAAGVEATLRGVNDAVIGPVGDFQPLTDAHSGVLNPQAINCIRVFNQYGIVSWGARTLVGADELANEWKYIPVRRVALMMEETLFRATKWVLFEPNDELLWAKIRLNIGAYLMSLFRAGAFQNITGNPRDSYYVKCDSETTTQDDINKGIVNIEVGFAPLKPAEFVVIKIQQMPGDIQV